MYFTLKIKNGIVQIAAGPKIIQFVQITTCLSPIHYTTMRSRFNCHIYYTIYNIFTEFFNLNVWYYNLTHLYEVDYRLLSHISSYLYKIFMELFLSRQNDQIAPVLDTCDWHCVVTPSTYKSCIPLGLRVDSQASPLTKCCELDINSASYL